MDLICPARSGLIAYSHSWNSLSSMVCSKNPRCFVITEKVFLACKRNKTTDDKSEEIKALKRFPMKVLRMKGFANEKSGE